MSAKKYPVELSPKQRKKLKALSSRGKVSARKLTRARILLLADRNRPKGAMTDLQIHQILDVSLATVARIRRRFATSGLSAAIDEKPRSGRPIQFTGDQRAKVTALACSMAPEGQGQWSLRLLADRLVELEFVETISYRTVGHILKKTNFPRT
jgi:transposase